AVLIANVEEARYRALMSEDGRLLIDARYAVRNNQRSFLKVTMPAGSTVWSAEVGGRAIRPGVRLPTPCCCRSTRVTAARRRRPSGTRRSFQERAGRPHGSRLTAGARELSSVRAVDIHGLRADRRSARAVGRSPLQADPKVTFTPQDLMVCHDQTKHDDGGGG